MYHKWQLHHVWFLKCGVQRTEFFVLLDHFSPFYPTNDPKNHNFRKMKNTPGGIILHMCTIIQSMTIIWCPVPEMWSAMDRNFCHFGPFFSHFTPLTNPKNQNFEKMKKIMWRYYHFTHVYHKWQLYEVWFLRYGAQRTECFVILDRFFALLPP